MSVNPAMVKKSKLSKEELAEISRENGKKSAEVGKEVIYEVSAPMELETDLADLHADIYDPRAKIAPELKIHAAYCFMEFGTVTAASKACGISHQLLSEWKSKALWWTPVLMKIRKAKQDELDSMFTGMITKTATQLLDRIEHGEEVVTKDGIVLKQLTGRDLASILNTLYDKRSMLRGDPTSISAKTTSQDVLQDLRKEFAAIAEGVLEKKVVHEIPTQN